MGSAPKPRVLVDFAVVRSLLSRIRDAYPGLTPAERKLADLILSFPGEIAGFSASELAQMSSTSNAAVSRFVQRIGFSKYEEMRRLSRDAQAGGSPLYLVARDGEAPPFRTAPASLRNIEAMLAELDEAGLRAVVGKLARARKLWVVGFRHGHFLAGYVQWQLKHLRPDVHLVPKAGETLGENLADLGPEDAVVLFALRRRVPAIGALIRMARGAGASVVAIADQTFAENGPGLDILRCRTTGPSPIDDHSAVMVLCHAIVDLCLLELGRAGHARLARIEELHEDAEEL